MHTCTICGHTGRRKMQAGYAWLCRSKRACNRRKAQGRARTGNYVRTSWR